jgi:hypothetical protein
VKRTILLVGLLASFLALQGCSVISDLGKVVDAAAAAVPILQSLGVNVPTLAVAYVDDVASCVAGQNGSTQPSSAQYAAIVGCLAGDVAPTLGPGVASAVVAIVAQIAKDVQNLLAENGPQTAVFMQIPAHKLSAKDTAKLKTIIAKAVTVHAALKPMRH